MTHTYKITGMTCHNCQDKVQALLSKIDGVSNVKIDLTKGEAEIGMDKHVPTSELQQALKAYPKYQLTESNNKEGYNDPSFKKEETKPWIQTYKPILLIFGYITALAVLIEISSGDFNWMRAMQIFMAGFFLSFSFFKMLDLPAFADSYSTYDLVAKRFRAWGYIYAFIELALGMAYATGFEPLLTNLVTLIVMSVSIVGVIRSLLRKQRIRCACLGTVFELPMSTVTFIEDALMIGMSAGMIFVIS